MITPLAVILPWLVLAVGCWIGFQLIRQNGRIMLRLESLEHQLALASAAGATVEAKDVTKAAANGNGANANGRGHGEHLAGNRPLTTSKINRDGLRAGAAAPEFRLPRVDGGEISLTEYRGR